MSILFETPGLKPVASLSMNVWRIMGFYANNQADEGSSYIKSNLTEQETSKEAWWAGLDFCRMFGKDKLQAELTEKYATVFNRPPPDWTSQTVEQVQSSPSKGLTLNILSVSNPESDQYASVFNNSFDKKLALLLKFTPGRQLSWQEGAVQRLNKGVQSLKKAKVPIYIENPGVILEHIKKIPFDRRSDSEWGLIFYLLLYVKNEMAFEEEALQYTLAKGMSPPSFENLDYPPINTWFADAPSTATNPSSLAEEFGNTIILTGNLVNQVSGLSQRASARLQRQESIVLDMRGVVQADWTSIFDIANLHHKIWATNSRKLYFTKITPLLTRMLEMAGVPENSFVDQKS